MATLTRIARLIEDPIADLKQCYEALYASGNVPIQNFNSADGIRSAYLTCLAVADKSDRVLPGLDAVLRAAIDFDASAVDRPWLASPHKQGLAVQQCEAFDKIHDWYFNSSQQHYLLKGGAGTGKTYSISKIIKSLQEINGVRFRVAIVAPTHKAVNVVRGFVQKSGLYNVKVGTMQSLLNLRPGAYSANAKRKMERDKGSMGDRYENYHLVIADEAGMIGDDMLAQIPTSVRTLFMGDWAQLCPVPDDELDRMTEPPLSLVFNTKATFELTDVHRNDGAIARTALSLREAMRGGGKFKLFLEGNLTALKEDKWANLLIESVEGGVDAKALAFTNARVAATNAQVRSALFPGAEKYIAGDKLQAKEPIFKIPDAGEWAAYCEINDISSSRKKPDSDKNKPILMQTASECVVLNVGRAELQLWHPLLLGPRVQCYELNVLSDDGLVFSPLAVHGDSRSAACAYLSELVEVIRKLVPLARARHWGAYYSLLEDLNLVVKKTKYLDRLQYGYAITVHQSQGSTIEFAMPDFANISKCQAPMMRKQLQMVALTRPSDRACLLL